MLFKGPDLDQRSHIESVLALTFISETFEEGSYIIVGSPACQTKTLWNKDYPSCLRLCASIPSSSIISQCCSSFVFFLVVLIKLNFQSVVLRATMNTLSIVRH